MRVSAIQMDMKLGEPEYNFAHAVELVRRAAATGADVVTLPETWNVGFFPSENLEALSDREGERVKATFGPLAKELGVNIVAGSVSNVRGGKIYNTSYTFNRQGEVVADYDKTHLFSPMGEHHSFEFGERLVTFELDGVRCGIVICYDIRFLELERSLALRGIDLLFVVAQWPKLRTRHWEILNTARAIENQMFVVATNSCGTAGQTKYAGHSILLDPWGEVLVLGGEGEQILTADLDLEVVRGIRESINVYRDRRPALYEIK